MKLLLPFFFFLFFAFIPFSLAEITVHVGPVSVGVGGPNPISIPPTNAIEYEFVWIKDNKRELTLGVSPGIFYGVRNPFPSGFYISMGGGYVIDIIDQGPGIYTAFGYGANCTGVCFNFEYKQAIGFTAKHTINPYAVRIGVTFGIL